MAAISPFLKYNASFDQKDIEIMSMALVDVCRALGVSGNNPTAAEVVAVRIVELARRVERNPTKLRDRVLSETDGASGGQP